MCTKYTENFSQNRSGAATTPIPGDSNSNDNVSTAANFVFKVNKVSKQFKFRTNSLKFSLDFQVRI